MSRGKTIERLYAWIVTEPDGTEGIPAVSIGTLALPLVGSDKQRIESFREVAMATAKSQNLPLRLVEFTGLVVLETHPAKVRA